MIRLIIFLLVIALIAALFGFGGIAEGITDIAQIVFYIFIALFAISLLFRLIRGR